MSELELLTLKNSEVKVPRLAFGGCPMGGHGWGEVSRDALIQAVRQGLDNGLTFFDTADTYGLGEGERTLGEALGGRRAEAVIATKFGVRVEQGRTFYDNSPAWIRSALRASLARLGTDYVDVYQIHYRDGSTPLGVVVETLQDLRDEGHIRHFGLSNISGDDAKELSDCSGIFATFQNQLSLANRDSQGTIEELSTGLTPMTWGSLGQGILTGKYGPEQTFGADDRRSREIYSNFHGANFTRNLGIVQELRRISHEVDKPIAAVAVRWILDAVPESVAITGVKNAAQLDANLAALGWSLSADQMATLNGISKGPTSG